MKINIDKIEFKREVVGTREFELPEVPTYYFETHVRRSIRMIPEFISFMEARTDENGNNYLFIDDNIQTLYGYRVTCVYDSWNTKIEIFNIKVSDMKEIQKENTFIHAFTNNYFDSRTKEQFDADLKVVLDKINEE